MTAIPVEVVEMVLTGDRRRADRADTAWRTLTKFERRVVREAAVMGYVLGRQDGRIDGNRYPHEPFPFPGDFDIVRQVLQHCDSTDDLYPYLGEACAGRRRRITRKRMWPGEAVS